MTTENRPKLLEQVRMRVRTKGYAKSTEKTYVYWNRDYILFHNKRHPAEMGAHEIEVCLTHLANGRHLSPSSQNQALNAIVFLYREILRIELPQTIQAVRAKQRERLPPVLPAEDVRAVLMYGSGLRVRECVELRIQDIDLTGGRIIVMDGKGRKDRATLLPESLKVPETDPKRTVHSSTGPRARIWPRHFAALSPQKVSASKPRILMAIPISRPYTISQSPRPVSGAGGMYSLR